MEEMLREARDSNWQALNRLDSERRVIIESNLQTSNGPLTSSKESKRLLAHRIQELDAALNQIVLQARENLVNENRQHACQVKAMQGYAQANALI